jgi:diaminohydroxyphosphoribosylaminopyrimidine deaminase/5-amino-6-(5-phosphoribosylamino)uracil reductase
MASPVDHQLMGRAMKNASRVRFITSPNPWVGAVIATRDGEIFDGATRPPGGPHAERVALDAAGDKACGATLYSTLEPCDHTGRTGPCTEAIIAADVARVVVGCPDPDTNVSGRGVQKLRSAGIEVEVGVDAIDIGEQLLPYLHHRRHGRPYVIVKLASSMDGRIAAPDGTSQWITGPEARQQAHQMRAESDAIIVGAGTVRSDDPMLTVRDWAPPADVEAPDLDPRRVVLGKAPPSAKVHPCHEFSGNVVDVLDQLGRDGVLQVMVEGGAQTVGSFHAAGLVDRYELFMAPALFGGDDASPLLAGFGAQTMADVWRGEIVHVARVGGDLHVSLVPVDP